MAEADAPRPSAQSPNRRDLTQGPIARTLLAFALPTLGSSIIQSLNGSINAAWVGRLIGEDALAATANANMTVFVLTAFTFGFSMASSILIGQAFGRRDIDSARRAYGNAVGFFALLGTLVAIGGWFLSPHILGLLGTPAEAVPLADAYLRVIFLGMPPTILLVMSMMALRGSGDSLTPLWFMILAVILDSGLNPLFIAGIGPFPKMGIAGSATATVIANWVALAGLVIYIYARDLVLRLRGAELAYLNPFGPTLKSIVFKGFPMGLQMIVISLSSLLLVGLVNRQGVHTTAAYGVTMQLWTYIQMPAMAFGAAVSAMTAQNIGAGRWDRVTQITRTAVVQTLIITASLIALFLLFEKPALGLFLGMDSPALPIAMHIQWIATWSFLLFGITLVLFGTVRANGAVVGPLVILAIGLLPVRLGVAWLGEPLIGPDALWWSFPASTLVNLVLAILYYRSGHWRQAKMGAGRTQPAAV
ncbi:MATE family efflux transporter [Sphingomonas astaxanthinifaciens]|uniref:MATE family efflux transporter n=1 Tax=Sphingomonas astaxanthinifaciens DSM 22298 TaxID=1123267 RepID=A0ABQ5ZAM7_9SPHN|nr:MATE family efflux transporter [Sphingomonas astaxanthinifaciens]GLR47662.1 MATE family efflux transporter [Sphingomonas astaxanthinifaciens DSM 22298]